MENSKKINKLKLNQETLRNMNVELANNLINSHHTACSAVSVCGLPCTP